MAAGITNVTYLLLTGSTVTTLVGDDWIATGINGVFEQKSGGSLITFVHNRDSNYGASNYSVIEATGGDGVISGGGTLTGHKYTSRQNPTGNGSSIADVVVGTTPVDFVFILGVSNTTVTARIKIVSSDASFADFFIDVQNAGGSGDRDIRIEFTAETGVGGSINIMLDDYDPSNTPTYSATQNTYTCWRALDATVTAGGVLGTIYYLAVSGALTVAGAISRKISKNILGSLTSTGTISKKISKSLSGSITPFATLLNGVSLTMLVEGSITMSGGVAKLIRKGVFGTLDIAGSISKKISRTLGGTLTMTGLDRKKISKKFLGSITPFASLVTTLRTSMTLTGVLSPFSSLVSQVVAYVAPPEGSSSNLNFIRRFIGRR